MSRQHLINEKEYSKLFSTATALMAKLDHALAPLRLDRDLLLMQNYSQALRHYLGTRRITTLEHTLFVERCGVEELCVEKPQIETELKHTREQRSAASKEHKEQYSALEKAVTNCAAPAAVKRKALSCLLSLKDVATYEPEKAPKALQNLKSASAESCAEGLLRHNYRGSGLALGAAG